jgi:Rieske Fe-S protein
MGAPNVFIATGDSGHGMTHGTIAGVLLTDLICERPNRWEQLYNPMRVVPAAAKEFVRDNANIASQYVDWIAPGDAMSEDDILPGNGGVVRRGLKKVAVYRDAVGRLHECSAICPHLGGIVRWNPTEKTWDCPVHGSRFDCEGHVVSGPANTDLSPVHASAR